MRTIIMNSAAIALALLPLTPLSCLASGGKVAYPDGSPAGGAQVKLLFDDLGSRVGGKITGGHQKIEMTVTCDNSGRFSFPAQVASHTVLQVKGRDGQDFASVTLPTKLFSNGNIAIVLQPAK